MFQAMTVSMRFGVHPTGMAYLQQSEYIEFVACALSRSTFTKLNFPAGTETKPTAEILLQAKV